MGSLSVVDTIAEVLQCLKVPAWLVGGTVRDRMLGRETPDVDLVVGGDPAVVSREVAKVFKAPWFALSQRHRTYRVLIGEGTVDVAPLRGSSILDDLACRDFTVNAIALSIPGGELVDPFGGIEHLSERRLVPVSDRVFMDDPVRLLRAVRLAHVLGFTLDAETRVQVRSQASLLSATAAERITVEIVLTLAAGRTSQAVGLWEDLGLLAVFLPEAATTGNCQVDKGLLQRIDSILDCLDIWFPDQAVLLAERLRQPVDGAVGRTVALRLAGLLTGAGIRGVENAGLRLRFSRDLVSLLRVWAGVAMGKPSPLAALEAGDGRSFSQPGPEVVLFFWGVAPWEPEVVLLSAARAAAMEQGGAPSAKVLVEGGNEGEGARGQTPVLPTDLNRLRWLMGVWAMRWLEGVPSCPVGGTELMTELGIPAGPLLGKILREVQLAWEAGDANTREQLLALARQHLEAARGVSASSVPAPG